MKVSKKVTFVRDWIFNYVNSMPKKAQSLVIGINLFFLFPRLFDKKISLFINIRNIHFI